MRLWSLHPRYLDSKGLVALWREALLAQNVLRGNTRGYRQHPQLIRFREQTAPLQAIGTYLFHVHEEASLRGFRFDKAKIDYSGDRADLMQVSDGQLAFEWEHLKRKLQMRDPQRLFFIGSVQLPEPHPLFSVVTGAIADWERV